MKLRTAVNRAIDALPLAGQDGAAAELARHQATAIDADPDLLKKIGPQLLETLSELGMTPKARNAVVRKDTNGSRGKLAELRSLRP